MGKRMNGQLTIIEFSVIVMMGAILAVPMQIPDRGLLQGILILLCMLLLLRGINWVAFKSSRFEKLLHGEASLLVKDGVLQLRDMKRCNISPQELFGILRSKNIFQLGKVKRCYLEGCGQFSVYTMSESTTGLPLYQPISKSWTIRLQRCKMPVAGAAPCSQKKRRCVPAARALNGPPR